MSIGTLFMLYVMFISPIELFIDGAGGCFITEIHPLSETENAFTATVLIKCVEVVEEEPEEKHEEELEI